MRCPFFSYPKRFLHQKLTPLFETYPNPNKDHPRQLFLLRSNVLIFGWLLIYSCLGTPAENAHYCMAAGKPVQWELYAYLVCHAQQTLGSWRCATKESFVHQFALGYPQNQTSYPKITLQTSCPKAMTRYESAPIQYQQMLFFVGSPARTSWTSFLEERKPMK